MSHITLTVLGILLVIPVFTSTPIDNVRRETITLARELWRTPNRNTSEALSAIRQLTSKISRHHDIDERQRVFSKLSTIFRRTEIVQSYESFLLILAFRNTRNTTESDWIEFVENVFGAIPSMESIHRDVVNDDTVYGEVVKEHVDNVCENGQSNQQLLYNIYAAIQEAYLKIFVMTNSAWFLTSAIRNETSFEAKFENLTQEFGRISRAEATIIQRYLNTTSRSFWRCDPKEHQQDITYTSVKGLLQGYIVNEVDLSPGGSCQHGCSHFTSAALKGCQGSRCLQQKQCNGRLFNCDFYYSDMRVCLSPAESDRRYENIQFNNGTTFGKVKGSCEGQRIDSWWRVLPPSHCTYCFCQCEDHENESERFVSLHSAVADVSQNKLVTGVRFLKEGATLYLQIQQGSLLPHGDIDESSLEWVPVNTSARRFLLSFERRKIDLDDLHAPPGYALTGMRFRDLDGRLNPQIMMTPFNYETGTLDKEAMNTYWHGNSRNEFSLPHTRRQHQIHKGNVHPTQRTFPDSSSNTFVTLGPSDFDSDAAQTTIPLIDVQPVQPTIPCILSGAGVYHRGEPNSAGFIGPRLFSYDLSSHFDG